MLDQYPVYLQGADIGSFDIYPVNSEYPEVQGKLEYVAKGVDRLRMWTSDQKAIWNWIECTQIDVSAGRAPTPDEVKAEVWMSLVHGSRGIGYFAHRINPFDETGLLDDSQMKAAVAAINAQISSLAPALNTQSITNAVVASSSDPSVPVDTMAKRAGGTLYVFAVAMRGSPTQATFQVRQPADGTVTVLGEDRTIPLTNGSFADAFPGYGVHLYRVD
jgi:hypothetical protein